MTTEKQVSHAKPRKTKPTAAEQNKAAIAKMRQAALQYPQPAEEPEFAMVPASSITIRKQIREKFDEAALAELASDIATRGIIEPLVCRRDGAELVLIAGERRYRAALLAGLASVPAILRNVDETAATSDQLAENIHRESLTLEEEAACIEKLHAELGSLQAVAQKIHKSLPWVSKRYKLKDALGHYARRLLEDGITEDLEILRGVAQLETLSNGSNGPWALCEKIRRGEAGRSEVRDTIKAAKERKAERDKQLNHRFEFEQQTEANPPPEKPKEKKIFDPETQMWQLDRLLTEGRQVTQALWELQQKYDFVTEKLDLMLCKIYESQKIPDDKERYLLDLAINGNGCGPTTTAAWMKITNRPWNLNDCLDETRESARRMNERKKN